MKKVQECFALCFLIAKIMKNLKLVYNIFVPIALIVLAVSVFSERNNNSEPNPNVLNTILSSETINKQISQSRNIVVKNPDFTVAAEKTINSVVHVKNTAKAKNSNSLWDLFYGNSDDGTTIGTGSGVIVSSKVS